jgi:hypothetical protein
MTLRIAGSAWTLLASLLHRSENIVNQPVPLKVVHQEVLDSAGQREIQLVLVAEEEPFPVLVVVQRGPLFENPEPGKVYRQFLESGLSEPNSVPHSPWQQPIGLNTGSQFGSDPWLYQALYPACVENPTPESVLSKGELQSLMLGYQQLLA